jgi:hypothetical protein
MRGRIITAVAMGLGLFAAVPTFAAERGQEHQAQSRTVTHETRTVTHETKPVEVRDTHVNVVRQTNRDVHVDEHVTINNRRPDFDHDWDRDRVQFVPQPVVTVPVVVPVAVNTDCDTPIGLNQVPPVILNAVAQQTGGAPIIAVDYVQQGGGAFYDVRINGPFNVLQTLRFGINGGFVCNL